MLLSTVEPALACLVEALTATDYLGDPIWSARIPAAKTLLSRAGVGEQAKVIFETNDDASNLNTKELTESLEQVTRELRRREQQRALTQGESQTLVTYDNGETWHSAA